MYVILDLTSSEKKCKMEPQCITLDEKNRVFQLAGCTLNEVNNLEQMIGALGGTINNYNSQTSKIYNSSCTHILAKVIKPTEKILGGLAGGKLFHNLYH